MLRFFIFVIFLVGIVYFFDDAPPTHLSNNVCVIFQKKPTWYWAARKAQKQWHVPVAVQMAIIHEESHFKQDAKPPREKFLGLIPWLHKSSAQGYTQALNQTWRLYLKQTGRLSASRRRFYNAVDFIGWNVHRIAKRLRVKTTNAYVIYLAYHEGIGGYLAKTYVHKPGLVKIARNVAQQAQVYQAQLDYCKLPKKPWWRFW